MNFQEYRELAVRTARPMSPAQHVDHGKITLMTELGELADAYKKHRYYGRPLDLVNFVEESGDVLWGVALISHTVGFEVDTHSLHRSSPDIEATLRLCHIATSRVLDGDLANACRVLVNCIRSMLEQLGLSIEAAMTANIAKLSLRYGEAFSEHGAVVRDLQAEHELLKAKYRG